MKCFQEFRKAFEKGHETEIKYIHSDSGGEYMPESRYAETTVDLEVAPGVKKIQNVQNVFAFFVLREIWMSVTTLIFTAYSMDVHRTQIYE